MWGAAMCLGGSADAVPQVVFCVLVQEGGRAGEGMCVLIMHDPPPPPS